MSVGNICVREVDTVTPDESAATAAERMHQRAVGTLVVVDRDSHVIGIITDRDLVSRVLARKLNPTATAVRDAMTVGPKTVFAYTPIETALVAMRAGRFRRLPVVDRGNKLVGLITLDDILMLLAEEFSQIGRLLKRETPRSLMEESTSSLGTVSRFRSEARLGVGD
jgi:CBS domain-containing protein